MDALKELLDLAIITHTPLLDNNCFAYAQPLYCIAQVCDKHHMCMMANGGVIRGNTCRSNPKYRGVMGVRCGETRVTCDIIWSMCRNAKAQDTDTHWCSDVLRFRWDLHMVAKHSSSHSPLLRGARF